MKKEVLPKVYQAIAEDATYGIVVLDDRGQCVFVNRVATEMLKIATPKLADLIPKSERSQFKPFSADLLKHDGLYQDILVRSGSMTSFVAYVGVKRLNVDGLEAYLLMLQDVTLQKKMQRDILIKQNEIKATYEEILHQNRQLKELDLAKNRFIALTTHELRTPLSAMCASAEILKLKLYDTPEQMEEFVGIIYEQGLHLQELVNDILDFAKIQAGKMDFYIEQSAVNPVIESLTRSFEAMAEQNQVNLHFKTPAHDLLCYFDELRLRQVFANILNNAIKYNRTGGSVHVFFEQDEHAVRVLVEDTGQGMSEDQFDKVFNEFETIGQVANHHKGTGLGMPISRKLTEGMGGKLEFTSKLGVGSTFWIAIPKTKILEDAVYQSRPDKNAA